ncbi:hypothetical protein D3C85_1438700 [compost metagenome]
MKQNFTLVKIRSDLPPQIGQFKTVEWLPLLVALTTFERTHAGSDGQVSRGYGDGCSRPAKPEVFAAGRAA